MPEVGRETTRGAEEKAHAVTEPTIIYTHTDEAPALATYSFLPILQAFARRRRGDRRDAGHLAGGSHPRRLPRPPRPRRSATLTRSPSSAS